MLIINLLQVSRQTLTKRTQNPYLLVRWPIILLSLALALAHPALAQTPPNTLDDLAKSGNAHFKSGEDELALADAKKAIELDPKRYEGYALAALVQLRKGSLDDATASAAKALELGPEKRKPVLAQLRDSIAKAREKSIPSTEPETLPPDDLRRYSALKLILEDADHTSKPDDRANYLQEFMAKSNMFAKAHTNYMQVWVLRSVVALELNLAHAGCEAGQELLRLGASQANDEKLSKLMARLERKGWLESTFVPVQSTPRDFVGTWNYLHAGPVTTRTSSKVGTISLIAEMVLIEDNWTFAEEAGEVVLVGHHLTQTMNFLSGPALGERTMRWQFPPGTYSTYETKRAAAVKKKQLDVKTPETRVTYECHYLSETGTVEVKQTFGGLTSVSYIFLLDKNKDKLIRNPILGGRPLLVLNTDEDLISAIKQHGQPWSTNEAMGSSTGTRLTYGIKSSP